jgi:hypothetical protein
MRLREIAYRRLLFRLYDSQPQDWVIKGGAALLLRLDPNRTSNDIDLAFVREAGEHAVALAALQEAARQDAGDFFAFELGSGQFVEQEHPLERALSVPVVARIGEREFARFSVDLALPREDVDSEWVRPETTVTGNAVVDSLPPVATLTFPAQMADKVCAIYEIHGTAHTHSSRARDLADVAMIAEQVDLDGKRLGDRLRGEEQRRLDAGTLAAPLPEQLTLSAAQASDWSARWDRATRGAPINFERALQIAGDVMNPVLDGSVDGATWLAAEGRWDRRGDEGRTGS